MYMRRSASLALLWIAVVGLIALNVLSLTNSQVHRTAFEAVAKAIASVLPEAATARLLHQSVMYRHQALEQEHAEVRRTASRRAEVAKNVSGRVARRAVANAVKNVAAVAAEIVPVFGSAAVIALTISDVYDDCQTLKDLNELNTAFGDDRHDESHVCGMKVPFSN